MLNSFNSKQVFSDKSLYSLLVTNLLIIVIASIQGWNLFDLMWIYWWQSIIIAVFNFINIISLKDFSTEGFKLGNIEHPIANAKTKLKTGIFFILHFGLFHYGYYTYLADRSIAIIYQTNNNSGHTGEYFVPIALFFLNHLFSFFYNKIRDRRGVNIGTLMMYPYARIIPMHLILIFGYVIYLIFPSTALLIFFLLLKTLADIIMHIVEHSIFYRSAINKTGNAPPLLQK